jgi:hypothetical protein
MWLYPHLLSLTFSALEDGSKRNETERVEMLHNINSKMYNIRHKCIGLSVNKLQHNITVRICFSCAWITNCKFKMNETVHVTFGCVLLRKSGPPNAQDLRLPDKLPTAARVCSRFREMEAPWQSGTSQHETKCAQCCCRWLHGSHRHRPPVVWIGTDACQAIRLNRHRQQAWLTDLTDSMFYWLADWLVWLTSFAEWCRISFEKLTVPQLVKRSPK